MLVKLELVLHVLVCICGSSSECAARHMRKTLYMDASSIPKLADRCGAHCSPSTTYHRCTSALSTRFTPPSLLLPLQAASAISKLADQCGAHLLPCTNKLLELFNGALLSGVGLTMGAQPPASLRAMVEEDIRVVSDSVYIHSREGIGACRRRPEKMQCKFGRMTCA